MSVLKNDTFLRALLKQPVEYTPVWMMRQAGRYLPEYRALRTKAGSFLALCQNTEWATEVTLQPLQRFDLDAAILFSDILTVPDAMGLGLYFAESEGPKFHHPIQSEADVHRLAVPDMAKLRYVFDAVSSIKQALDGQVPLIGFSGSPFTLACYMIEGGSSRDFYHVKAMMYQRPDLLHRILAINAQAIVDYLNEQIIAGAQAIQIFDTWGGILSDAAFIEFSQQYLKQVISALISTSEGRIVPVIVFTKGAGQWLEVLAQTGAHAVGLDWTINLSQARNRIGHQVALQGNMDPMVLLGTPQILEAEVKRILANYGTGNGHVFNLGHGIGQFTNPKQVKLCIDKIHQHSRQYH